MRRPYCREIQPTGSVPAARPTTYMLIGSVANDTSGASCDPMIAPVATITVAFAPASACAIASRSTLARVRRSKPTTGTDAAADIEERFLA